MANACLSSDRRSPHPYREKAPPARTTPPRPRVSASGRPTARRPRIERPYRGNETATCFHDNPNAKPARFRHFPRTCAHLILLTTLCPVRNRLNSFHNYHQSWVNFFAVCKARSFIYTHCLHKTPRHTIIKSSDACRRLKTGNKIKFQLAIRI